MNKETTMQRLSREAAEKGLVFLAHTETNITQCIRDAKTLDDAVEILVTYLCNISEPVSSELQDKTNLIEKMRGALHSSDSLLRDLPQSGGLVGVAIMENNANVLSIG